MWLCVCSSEPECPSTARLPRALESQPARHRRLPPGEEPASPRHSTAGDGRKEFWQLEPRRCCTPCTSAQTWGSFAHACLLWEFSKLLECAQEQLNRSHAPGRHGGLCEGSVGCCLGRGECSSPRPAVRLPGGAQPHPHRHSNKEPRRLTGTGPSEGRPSPCSHTGPNEGRPSPYARPFAAPVGTLGRPAWQPRPPPSGFNSRI